MMKKQGLVCAGLILCVLGFAAVATAQEGAASATQEKEFSPEVAKLLKKVEPQLYSPYREGLKDISFEIYMPMMEMMGMGGVKFLYVWKAGDPAKTAFKIEGELPSPDMKEMMQSQMEAQAKSLADLMIVKPYFEKYRGHDTTLTQDGDLQKLAVTATSDDAGFKTQTLWINSEFLPVKATTEMENPMMGGTMSETSTFQYQMKGDRRLIQSISAESSMGTQEIKFEYQDVGKYTLLKKMTIESPANPMGPMSIEFRNISVDQNLDDSAFGGAK
jgi:hypothetical protein